MWVWQAVGLFAVTNIDDIVVLSVFFGRSRGVPGSARAIVAGQYLGFSSILAVSIAGALGANLLPGHVAAYLGLLPVALGLYAAWQAWWASRTDDEAPAATRPSMWVVAGVTLANGGDNAGVYVPVFAGHSAAVLVGDVIVFLVLVGVWCVAGRYLTAHEAIGGWLRRWGHVVHPVALIAIGLTILVTGGAFGL